MQKSDFTKECFGNLVPTISGQMAFAPGVLPPSMIWTPELVGYLSDADRAVGELNGIGLNLPNPHLLIEPFTRREAVLSSRIEGTQSQIKDLYLFDIEPQKDGPPDVQEVTNYVNALNYGLERIKELPISVRFACELHQILMKDVRGQHQAPGKLRRDQNWVGPAGCPIELATYIPPPPSKLGEILSLWEKFIHLPPTLPALIRLAMVHYQFEAVHPFCDGNGRIGRLLITIQLCSEGILHEPLLYLSAYFEHNRNAYYRHLLKVSTEGRWTDWILFFLEGVREQSKDAFERARRLLDLKEEFHKILHTSQRSALQLKLVDELFVNPFLTTTRAVKILNVTPAAAQGNINKLIKAGILREITGRKKYRIYLAEEIMRTISD